MIKLASEKPAILSSTFQKQTTLLSLLNSDSLPEKSQKLIAQWVIDENSKLYCQWVKVK